MRECNFGRIVLISSAAALEPQEVQPDYGAAKAAMVNLVVSTSKWLRNSGVTINAISPGAVLTPALESFLQSVAARKGWSGDADAIEKTAAKSMFRIPVGRGGRADDIAGMVAYLSSSWAGYIHGANIHINGGVVGTFT
jgi:NAD(P)-dependent dehydrogenase (short-subunit alcohol dehydrogenase family)